MGQDMDPTAPSSVHCSPVSAEDTSPLRPSFDQMHRDAPVSDVILPYDKHGWHFGAFQPSLDISVAFISLYIEPHPIDNGYRATDRCKYVAARLTYDPVFQGRRIGTNCWHGILFVSTELKGNMLWCDARLTSLDLYFKRGLMPSGTFYKGSVECVRMKLDIKTAGGRGVLDGTFKSGLSGLLSGCIG